VGGRRAPQRNCVYTTPLVWSESNEGGFQSLARRSRYSIRQLKFECGCFLTAHSKRVLGLRNRSSFGPNSTRPAQIWPYACVPDPNRSEPSREGRALVCNLSVTGPLSAASARYLRIGDSDIRAVKTRFLETATYNRSHKPAVLVNFPFRFTLRRRA